MTTEVKVTLTQFTGYPVFVKVKDSQGNITHEDTLHDKGESVSVFVHQNQDIIVGEIKTGAA